MSSWGYNTNTREMGLWKETGRGKEKWVSLEKIREGWQVRSHQLLTQLSVTTAGTGWQVKWAHSSPLWRICSLLYMNHTPALGGSLHLSQDTFVFFLPQFSVYKSLPDECSISQSHLRLCIFYLEISIHHRFTVSDGTPWNLGSSSRSLPGLQREVRYGLPTESSLQEKKNTVQWLLFIVEQWKM